MAVDLQRQLEEAEQAYHSLMTGQSVAEFRDQNGELIRYTPANASRLLGYIHSLKSQLGLIPAGSIGPGRVWF
ncbi:gpW family head-tail joining protein [Stutzerimonas nitrititolerans]|uniref:gpW family head-tail joining protein n=1 Tax=Stutzerimonas nitrititolerans TaxID=2482751 RepID=UPI0028A23518|nr:gpW family head-tail joining protein [Stutzerimonas nitrititolerans]